MLWFETKVADLALKFFNAGVPRQVQPFFSVHSYKIGALKKLLTSIVIFLFLFNLSGYYLYYKYFIYRADQQAISQIDNHLYEESELMEIKIALNLPYLTGNGQYERIDGEIQHQGVYYNYVERKVSNDTLYLKCRPNSLKTDLQNSLAEYTKNVNAIPSSEKNGNASLKKLSLTCEYIQHSLVYLVNMVAAPAAEHMSAMHLQLPGSFIEDFFKPPRRIFC